MDSYDSSNLERIPSQIMVAAFTSADGAIQALSKVAQLSWEDDSFPAISHAMIVVKDGGSNSDKTHVKEFGNSTFITNLLNPTNSLEPAYDEVLGGTGLALLGPMGINTGAHRIMMMMTMSGLLDGGSPSQSSARPAIGMHSLMTYQKMDNRTRTSVQQALHPGTSALLTVMSEVVVKSNGSIFERRQHFFNSTGNADSNESILDDTTKLITCNQSEGNDCAILYAFTDTGIVGKKVTVSPTTTTMDIAELFLTSTSPADTTDNESLKEAGINPEAIRNLQDAFEYSLQAPGANRHWIADDGSTRMVGW